MRETKNLKPFQIDGNKPFSQRFLHTQVKNIFQSLKNLKRNQDISFSKFQNSLNFDENTYILSLKSKLTKSHIFKKQTSRNIKLMHLVHMLLICGL